MEVIPTVLTSEVDEVRKNLEMAGASGVISWMQFDVIDGKYADNVTLGPEVLKELDEELVRGFRWEAHLMVENPVEWVERCAEAGMERVTAQIEMMEDQLKFVDLVSKAGMEVGLAVDLGTDIEEVDREVWKWVDSMLFMGVNAGFSGQSFDARVLEKIERAVNIRKVGGYVFVVEVDGGVNLETVGPPAQAGADAVCGNSAVYKDGKVRENVEELMKRAGVGTGQV